MTDDGTTSLSKKGSTGGSTPFSGTLLTAKLHFNDAPTQTQPANGITLPAIAENTTSKTLTVTTLVKTDAQASDPDKGTLLGMAITGVTGLGVWQYRLTATSAWVNVPANESATSALLLPSTASSLHFVPTADQTGTASLSWLAWDGTQGTAGQTFNASVTGLATAFSSTTATATLTVTPLATPPAPAWVGTGAVLTPVLPGSTINTITPSQVSTVFGPYFSDPGATVGIAISGVTGTKSGTWKYSIDGGHSFVNLPTVSAKSALLLSGNDLIEFVPNAGFVGTVALTAHAWDGGGSVGLSYAVNLTLAHSTGGSTHFSATTLTATELVNNSPMLS